MKRCIKAPDLREPWKRLLRRRNASQIVRLVEWREWGERIERFNVFRTQQNRAIKVYATVNNTVANGLSRDIRCQFSQQRENMGNAVTGLSEADFA